MIIGYDTMGTATTHDDVLIMADPYDATDHNQDGYGIFSAQCFLSEFFYYSVERDRIVKNEVLVAAPVPEQGAGKRASLTPSSK